jgi:hypothetical protein
MQNFNKEKLSELKEKILSETNGKNIKIEELISLIDVSEKFILYCVNNNLLSEFNFDKQTKSFSRKLRLLK